MSLRDELQSIYDKHGRLTPDLVVLEARRPSHPLHERFEWNDKAAGESWRREQARELIRSVRVVYREATENDPSEEVREWHSVRTPSGHVYEPLEKVVEDPLVQAMVLRDMQREWQQLHRRYKHMQEFIAMVKADVA